MTLAEIRALLLRELAVKAMAGDMHARDRAALLLRLGRPLVRRHVHPTQRMAVYDAQLCERNDYVVERVERDNLLFDRPRAVIPMAVFLDALVNGGVRDA